MLFCTKNVKYAWNRSFQVVTQCKPKALTTKAMEDASHHKTYIEIQLKIGSSPFSGVVFCSGL